MPTKAEAATANLTYGDAHTGEPYVVNVCFTRIKNDKRSRTVGTVVDLKMEYALNRRGRKEKDVQTFFTC